VCSGSEIQPVAVGGEATALRETLWDALMLIAVAALNVDLEYVLRWLNPTGLAAVECRTFQLACLVSTVGTYTEHIVKSWPAARRGRGRHTR
jgi:hypothetical protein